MQEGRRLGASKKPRELNLASGRRQQIISAHDERDALLEIVGGRRELIRPVALAIADEQIAALLVRPLLLKAMAQIDEAFDRRLELHADADAGSLNDATIATRARVRWGGLFRPPRAALQGPRHLRPHLP